MSNEHLAKELDAVISEPFKHTAFNSDVEDLSARIERLAAASERNNTT